MPCSTFHPVALVDDSHADAEARLDQLLDEYQLGVEECHVLTDLLDQAHDAGWADQCAIEWVADHPNEHRDRTWVNHERSWLAVKLDLRWAADYYRPPRPARTELVEIVCDAYTAAKSLLARINDG